MEGGIDEYLDAGIDDLLRAGLSFGGDKMSVGQITMMPSSTLK